MIVHIIIFDIVFLIGEAKSGIMKNNDFPKLSSNDLGACSVPACLPSPRFCTYLFLVMFHSYYFTDLPVLHILFTNNLPSVYLITTKL